ncbi:class I SAM-dependent methyltransferase [Candidatus Giovannonibacteria bacterium]|nr:class I SAM-dependent methyltransferase [Candidatus Giovannonibacteria bacterium]
MYLIDAKDAEEYLSNPVDGRALNGGKLFLIEPPEDTELQPEDARWTKWKKLNKKYFENILAKENKSKIVIDVGVGGAPYEILHKFDKVIGIDFYPYRNAVIISDLNSKLPFKNNSCDIIFMSNVLEHISNPNLLLSECNRILRDGGLLIAAVPFLVSVHRPPYDFHRYTNFMLQKLLRDAGFSEIKVEALGSPLHLYETLQRQFFSLLPKNFPSFLWKKISFILFSFFKRFFQDLPPGDHYVQGYGFSGRKELNFR